MKFSAGHFTIFSATKRENLHGHNFNVGVSLDAEVSENGMCFNYCIYKDRLVALCAEWNERFILPAHSPYLRVEEEGEYIVAYFATERIPFLRRDVVILPIANATLEEFSRLLLEKLVADEEEIRRFGIKAMTVRVFSGPGQAAAASWRAVEVSQSVSG